MPVGLSKSFRLQVFGKHGYGFKLCNKCGARIKQTKKGLKPDAVARAPDGTLRSFYYCKKCKKSLSFGCA